MRLLFIAPSSRYMNPTNSLLPPMLLQAADVVFYGPGYVSAETIRRGIDRFVDDNGAFDFVVTTRSDWSIGTPDLAFMRNYTIPSFPDDLMVAFGRDCTAFLAGDTHRRILFLTDLDVYALPEDTARRMEDSGAFFVTWGEGFSRRNDELEVLKEEAFVRRKANRKIGGWHDFVERTKTRFISLGHFVAETEFVWRTLDGRPNVASVPGQQYHRRVVMRDALEKRGIKTPKGVFKKLMGAADRAGLQPFANPSLLKLYQSQFAEGIAATRYAYTDGSGYDRPIRKFFEIPAFGAVLMATPCCGFEEIGFVDKTTAMVVKAGEIADAIDWLEGNPDAAQRIADAGRDVVWRNHSVHARAEQFRRCLDAILAGRFAGSIWRDGAFEVRLA